MKKYYARLRSRCKIWEICWWWLFRATLIYALIQGLIHQGNGADISDPLQVAANLAGMFAWEIFMMTSDKNFLSKTPAYLQDLSVFALFLGSFCGKYLNWYYEIRLWDSALHLIGGGAAVVLGYEVLCAMQLRDKKLAPLNIVLFAAIGFSFLLGTAWELFEFTYDQISCMGGVIKGDAQHWSYELAKGTPKEITIFDPVYPERWAIMDTMGDIVLNTIGAVVAYIGLKICPYKHRGKTNNIVTTIEAESREAIKQEKKVKAAAK